MTGLSTALAVVGIVSIGTVLARRRRERRRRAARRAALGRALGVTIDLVAVVIGAGGTIHQAVAALATEGPLVVRPSFAQALRRSADDLLLVDALATIGPDLGPDFHPLLTALITAETDGAPLTGLLARLAADFDQRGRWEAEAGAGRLSVAVLAPLVVCLLPAVVVGAIVPLAVVALRQLGS